METMYQGAVVLRKAEAVREESPVVVCVCFLLIVVFFVVGNVL